jgi:tetratricopeptide (TPR) repeat protein
MRFSFVADHFQYIASIGLIVLAVGTLSSMLAGYARTIVLVAVLMALAYLTWQRGWVYSDSVALWQDTRQRNPSFISLLNLAQSLDERADDLDRRGNLAGAQRDHAAALAYFGEAEQREPGRPETYRFLGLALERRGRLAEAEEQYARGVRVADGMPLLQRKEQAHLYHSLGRMLEKRGDMENAGRFYGTAVELQPGWAEAHCSLGNVLRRKGAVDRAIGEYRQAVALQGDFAEAHLNLGLALAAQGRMNEAAEEAATALRLKPELLKQVEEMQQH